MFKCHDVDKFIIHCQASFEDCLDKFEHSKVDTIFVLNDHNQAIGSITDGDIRRALISNGMQFSKLVAQNIANKKFRYVTSSETPSTFGKIEMQTIPNLDNNKNINYVYTSSPTPIKLGSHYVTSNSEAFLIAEIGNNHQGSLENAFKLIDQAKVSGADCVKFQHRNLDLIYGARFQSTKMEGDLSAQYVAHLLDKYQLKKHDLFKCFDYASEIGIQVTCTPFDLHSLSDLNEYGLDYFKISSADFFNEELTGAIIENNKPVLISTGMSNDSELKLRLQVLADMTHNFIPLHCTSSYPAPYSSVNLKYLNEIKSNSNGHVGYSGHELGYEVPIAAVTLGAKVIEKHFTLDKTLEGNDHKISLLPEEFKEMSTKIRNVEIALMGDPHRRVVSQGEIINEVALKKSAYANRNLEPGEILAKSDIEFRSPRLGLTINGVKQFYGMPLTQRIRSGEPISTHAFQKTDSKLKFDFNRIVGLPVRYSEVTQVQKLFDCKFHEYHLSCHDINQESKFSNELALIKDFSVHAPELFFNDHLIDLASADPQYRSQSVKYIETVVQTTEKLKAYAGRSQAVNIIINVGGFSQSNFSDPTSKEGKYFNVAKSLDSIDFKGNIPAIQTMPPFPWHFGGRRFHNLFVLPKEIREFCEKYNYKICFDTSHTGMASNYFGFDLFEAMGSLKEMITHLHVADYEGVDGEGVSTGSGELELSRLLETVNKNKIHVPIVIEEWQGHLNSYSGFENALRALKENNF